MIFIAAVVAAATAAPAAKPADPAALAAASALVTQLDVRGQLMATMIRNIAAMRQGAAIRGMLAQQPGFIQAYQANKAKFDPAIAKAGAIQADIATQVVRDNAGAVVNAATQSYARNYTAAELKGLSDFYRSPIGQAFQAKQGRVSAEIGQATAQIIGSKIDAGMKANEKRLQAALAPLNSGAAPPPARK